MTTVLLVEDDAALRRALQTSLRARGFEVLEAGTGEAALALAGDHHPSLILLDLGLPDVEGVETLRRLRRSSAVPVIVLTARDRSPDKIEALDAGADDYVTKPFDTDELLARMRAALRRPGIAVPTGGVVHAEDVVIDLDRRRVQRAGEPVHLTPIELSLLETLVRNAGKLLTHDALLREVWGPAYGTESHYLRVYVAQLRRKLGDDASNPRLIVTETGLGYRWIGGEPTSS